MIYTEVENQTGGISDYLLQLSKVLAMQIVAMIGFDTLKGWTSSLRKNSSAKCRRIRSFTRRSRNSVTSSEISGNGKHVRPWHLHHRSVIKPLRRSVNGKRELENLSNRRKVCTASTGVRSQDLGCQWIHAG